MAGSHDMGLIDGIIQPLYTGFLGVVMPPASFVQRPIQWLQVISRYKATHCGGPNFGYDLCVNKTTLEQRETLDLSTWLSAYNGAEPVRRETLERFTATFKPYGFRASFFYPCYGMAETTLIVSGGRINDKPTYCTVEADALKQNRIVEVSEDARNAKHLVGCGHARLDTQIVIADPEWLTRCVPNQIGEIWVSGSSVAQGYWQRPEQTEKTFQAYLADTGEGPFLRTGDLGFLRNGELFITGRIKDVIIIRGRNYYPQDIELTVEKSHTALTANSGVAFAVDVNGEERLVVVQEVERTHRRQINVDEVVGAIRQAVSEEHELQVYAVVMLSPGSIPKTSSGKIQRHACKAGFLNGSLQEIARWSVTTPMQIFSTPTPSYDTLPKEDSLPVNTTVATQDVSKHRADQIINWLRGYARERINSRLIDERRCVPPYIMLDFGNQRMMGMQIPEEYGGLALKQRDFMRVMEQIAAVDLTLATIVSLNNTLGIRPIMGYATQTMKDDLLPILAKGRELSSFGMTEPGAGADIGAISTVAVPDGHGGWRIRGVKRWNGSAWAGMINVFVRLMDANSKSLGLTGFVVRQGTPGLRVGPEALTMGLRGIMQNAIYFDDVPVSPVDVLGELGNGTQPADDALFHARLGIGIVSVGGMKRCAQLMLRYASRRSVGIGKLLNNPVSLAVFGHLTGAITALETLLNQVAAMLDAGQTLPREVAVVAKISGSDYVWEAADSLVQMLGGRGYIETNIAPQIFRDARVLRIGEGPNESLKIFLGKSVVHTAHLVQFLRDRLSAHNIANTLHSSAQTIQDRCLKSTAYFADRSSALAWTYSLVGEVATFAVLLAAVEKANVLDRSTQIQRAVI